MNNDVKQPNDALKPASVEETTASKPLAVQAEDEAKAPKVDPVATQVETPVIEEDRSAFNCAACKGEGLQDGEHICPVCHGTGKV